MTSGYIWSRGLPWWLSGKEAAQEMLVRSVGQEDPLVEEIGNPLYYSCLGNPMDREAWQSIVHGVTKSWTRLSMHTHTHVFYLDIMTTV